jgi:DedD protein
MTKGSRRRGSGDRILESRHLIGLFLGVVILCAVFFSLGYVMGKSQYNGSVHAAFEPHSVPAIPAVPAVEKEKVVRREPASSAAGDWDFYADKSHNQIEAAAPEEKSDSPAPLHSKRESTPFIVPLDDRKPLHVSSAAVRSASPKTSNGAVIFQVAAVTRQGDALAMADALQRKKFPSFVLAPSSDNFYRVQVGPYPDQRSADAARSALDRAGFKTIIRR